MLEAGFVIMVVVLMFVAFCLGVMFGEHATGKETYRWLQDEAVDAALKFGLTSPESDTVMGLRDKFKKERM